MKKYSLSALAAAGLLAGGLATGANAADLGGNCCADLEERIAELESTTARKGNRKVSLTVSGWVSQQVLYWDDGKESNTYVTDTGSVSIGTHVKFSGQATIAPGWSAGYVLNIEPIQNDSLLVSQSSPNGGGVSALAAVAGGGGSFGVENSYWFIKSEQLGKLSVGKQSSAADNQAILPDGSGSLVVANYVLYDVNAFALRNTSGGLSGLTWGNIASCAPLNGGGGVAGDCDGYPINAVRYDSPVFAGFPVSASW
ncbi:MAG: porin, partial [Hyphomicrobium sp.]